MHLTVDTLKKIRRSVRPEQRVKMLAELHAAGFNACPASGLPVFDPYKAPQPLFDLFDYLRRALSGDSAALRAAANAAAALSRALQMRITH